MQKERIENYGTVKIGGAGNIREVEIKEFIQATFKDNRIVNVCELEDESFILSVENIASSGRGNHSMLLSKDSMFGLFSVMTLFIEKRGFDFQTEVDIALGNKQDIEYSCSKNLIK